MEISFYLPLPPEWLIGAFAWWWMLGVIVLLCLHFIGSLTNDELPYSDGQLTSKEWFHALTWLSLLSPILLAHKLTKPKPR